MANRIVPVIAVVALLVGGGIAVSKSVKRGPTASGNQYRTAKVERGLVKKTVSATGTLKPWSTVDIRSRAGGRVLSYAPDLVRHSDDPSKPLLPIDEGSTVKKGQVICTIDPSDTLLTYNQAKADIESNNAKISESSKQMQLQEEQTLVSIATANANLNAMRASERAAKSKYDSAKSQANAQAGLTEANLQNAQATLDAENERLNQLRTATNLQQDVESKANLRQAKANLVNAKKNLDRQKELLKQGFVAESAVDSAQATYDVAEATVQSSQERADTMQPQIDTDVRTQQAKVRQAQAMLATAQANRVEVALKKQAAEASFADWKRSQADVAQAEASLRQAKANHFNDAIRGTQIVQAKASRARSDASLANAQVQLNETRIIAPSDGVILKKYVDAGTLITSGLSFNSTGTNIVQLGDVSRMYVDVQVDETDLANVDTDQKVDITFDSYATTPFEGKVFKIQPQLVVDQNVTTVHVWVEVDNDAQAFKLLKPGMNATCEFIVDKQDEVVSVPNEAMHAESDNSHYVEIASGGTQAPAEKDAPPDPELFIGVKVEKRKVELGLEGNDSTEIKDGLKEGETIVIQTVEPAAGSGGGGSPFSSGKGPGKK